MSDRKKAIETLKQLRLDYEEFYEEHNNEVTQAYDMAISSLETDEAYQLEYEPTTKNDLGVDAVSRKAVHDMLENLPITVEDKWFNWLQKACMRLAELPSATPIRPKGHWIEQIDHEENCRTLICSNCDRPALHDGDSIWKHKFCPHCGADMRGE